MENDSIMLSRHMLLHSLECSDDAGIATVKKDISMLEAALKKLAQHEEKYTDELNDALFASGVTNRQMSGVCSQK